MHGAPKPDRNVVARTLAKRTQRVRATFEYLTTHGLSLFGLASTRIGVPPPSALNSEM